MPCPFEFIAVVFDQPLQEVKFSSIKAVIVDQTNVRLQPELGFIRALPHMDVRRLVWSSFIAVEEKSITSRSEDDRHRAPFVRDRKQREAVFHLMA
jgi:hypothetical protein